MKKIIKISINFFLISIFFLEINASEKSNDVLKIGDENAKVTVKVFSSLTCPHCATFHLEVFEKLKTDYINKGFVKFEHHAFPLDLAALNAEILVRCNSDQNKSFQYLKEIYKLQSKWAVGSDIKKINKAIINIGKKINLDKKSLDKCLINDDAQEKVLNERILAQKNYNITSTPTIYLNEKKYNGDFKYENFKKEIEKLL
jgi:protein-disulfide isomerase